MLVVEVLPVPALQAERVQRHHVVTKEQQQIPKLLRDVVGRPQIDVR